MTGQAEPRRARAAGERADEAEVDALTAAVRRANVILDASSAVAQNTLRLGRTDLLALELLSLSEMTAGDIAEQLRISTGTVTGVIDRLEKGGYVARRDDARDRRRVVVVMTTSGRRRFRDAFRARRQWLHDAATELSADDLDVVVRFLQRMHDFMPEEWRPEARPQGALSDAGLPS